MLHNILDSGTVHIEAYLVHFIAQDEMTLGVYCPNKHQLNQSKDQIVPLPQSTIPHLDSSVGDMSYVRSPFIVEYEMGRDNNPVKSFNDGKVRIAQAKALIQNTEFDERTHVYLPLEAIIEMKKEGTKYNEDLAFFENAGRYMASALKPNSDSKFNVKAGIFLKEVFGYLSRVELELLDTEGVVETLDDVLN